MSWRADARRRARTTVLVTGFGPFPGVPVNATMRLLPELARAAHRQFPDVHLAAEVLPTEWVTAPRRLERLLAELAPDFALHFGVSSRARGFEIERRARNVCAMQPDAVGLPPSAAQLSDGGAEHLHASVPVEHIVTRLRRRGIPAFASRDAGAYLCNATLYHSLSSARQAPGRRIGFVHLPASLARPGGPNRGRSGACPLTWEQALGGALEILAVCLARPAVAAAAVGWVGPKAGSQHLGR
jgi:pyroglutamyl-peptidase